MVESKNFVKFFGLYKGKSLKAFDLRFSHRREGRAGAAAGKEASVTRMKREV